MKTNIILLLCILTSTWGIAQTYGYVSDAKTGEKLPGAIVFTANGARQTTTNQYGYYSIDADTDSIGCSFVGYTTILVKCNHGERIDIKMNELHANIGEVTVVSQSTFQRELDTPQMGHHKLTAKDIRSTPVMFGEADVLKAIQFMPGVNSAADGSVNMSVRGGSHDQNIILLDEATIYNPSHAMGIFTAFNPDAISSADFYKSCFPARYGGKLSSVVDMKMKEGNMKDFNINGGIGSVASRLLVEGPIKSDVASFAINGRYGYGDAVNAIAHLLDDQFSHNNDIMRFYDLSAKVNVNADANNHLYASAYASHDEFKCSILSLDNRQKWGNKTATLRWNHIGDNRTFANYTLTYSDYDYMQKQDKDVRNYEWQAGMSEVTAKADFDRYGDVHTSFGGGVEYHKYNPGEIVPCDTSSVMKPIHLSQSKMGLAYAYADIRSSIFVPELKVDAGIRVTGMLSKDPVAGAEPRLSLNYSPTSDISIKASASHTMQYQHLLSSSALGLPTDIWLAADKDIRPQNATTISGGVYATINALRLEISAEAYHKRMNKIIDFKDGAEFTFNMNLRNEVLSGEGQADGAEFMLRHNSRLFTAIASYTYSKARRRIEGVNGGKWYYAVYDQRHNFATTVTAHLGRNELSAAWHYHTGGRTTLPEATFVYA